MSIEETTPQSLVIPAPKSGQPSQATQPAHQAPVSSPAVRWFAIILGLLLIALAVLCGRELVLRNGNPLWWSSLLDPIMGKLVVPDYQPWMTWAAVIAIVVGLFFLLIGVKPRVRRHIHIPADVDVWARPVDIARYLTAYSKGLPGIQTATTTVKKNKIIHGARVHGEDAAILNLGDLENQILSHARLVFPTMETILVSVKPEVQKQVDSQVKEVPHE